jgi:hypothetical protein
LSLEASVLPDILTEFISVKTVIIKVKRRVLWLMLLFLVEVVIIFMGELVYGYSLHSIVATFVKHGHPFFMSFLIFRAASINFDVKLL